MKSKDLNFKTEQSLINQKNNFFIKGGIAKCIEYENRTFFKFIDLKGKDLIEFGCGIFPSSLGLKDNSMPRNYIASDTSKKIIKVAKLNDKRPKYKVINLEKKIINKKKYDLIVLKGVLHHIKRPEKVLIKLKSILKPKGIIIISEPNLSSIIGNFLKWSLEFFFKRNMEDSPYGQYDYNKISLSIKKANLKIYRKWYSSLLLLILTGDYGRIKIFPDNRYLFGVFIIFEEIINRLSSFFKISKFVNFKINLIVKN